VRETILAEVKTEEEEDAAKALSKAA